MWYTWVQESECLQAYKVDLKYIAAQMGTADRKKESIVFIASEFVSLPWFDTIP